MQNAKIGDLIRVMRLEHHMTQKQLADKMNISDKAVSKWERGLGLPDISLIAELARLLDLDMQNLLVGDLRPNDFVNGNMKNTKIYVCPVCHNITFCTGTAMVSCCGKKLKEQIAKKAAEEDKLSVQVVEKDWYITTSHPMTKDHYISFVAFVTGDRIQIIKQYPEWNLGVHIPIEGHGMLVWYCTEHGLYSQML